MKFKYIGLFVLFIELFIIFARIDLYPMVAMVLICVGCIAAKFIVDVKDSVMEELEEEDVDIMPIQGDDEDGDSAFSASLQSVNGISKEVAGEDGSVGDAETEKDEKGPFIDKEGYIDVSFPDFNTKAPSMPVFLEVLKNIFKIIFSPVLLSVVLLVFMVIYSPNAIGAAISTGINSSLLVRYIVYGLIIPVIFGSIVKLWYFDEMTSTPMASMLGAVKVELVFLFVGIAVCINWAQYIEIATKFVDKLGF